MSMSIESALSNCFDRTTPDGSNNPFMAMWNSLFFKNAHVPISKGMKKLKAEDKSIEALLMYLHTDTFTKDTVKTITDDLEKHLLSVSGDKQLRQATLSKLNAFVTMVLANYKYEPVGRQISIFQMCQVLRIDKSDWSRKGRPSEWSKWYFALSLYLDVQQSKGIDFLQPYINETQRKLAGAFG